MEMRLNWTHQPYEKMWSHLLMLTSPSNVRKLLSGEMISGRNINLKPSSLLDKKTQQIATSVSQAHEYYQAADVVSIKTSPLLYFYGMLSLAKALIIANHPSLLLQDIKYHGLATRPRNGELEKYTKEEKSWSIYKEFAISRPGVFPWLTSLTIDFEFPEFSVFRLSNLMIVDPQLADVHERITGIRSHIQYIYDHSQNDAPFSMKILPRTTDQESFEALFPEIKEDFELQPEIQHEQALVYKSKPSLNSAPCSFGIYYPIPGGRYLVRGVEYDEKEVKHIQYILPELSDYIFMYILSNCVRYKQDFWTRLVQGEESGAIPLINIAISNARLRFPNFILNHFFNERFEYGIPSRLM